LSLGLGVEPKKYKVISYNQLTPDEVAKTNYEIRKLIFWEIMTSVPGETAVDAPHITTYWYGPTISSEGGRIIHMKSTKFDPEYTEKILSLLKQRVGGTVSHKEGGEEFKDFTMKISYESISNLAKEMERVGKLACELSLEFGLIAKEERASSTLPKSKVLGEKPLEE
jgi:hypothetical protein